MTQEQPTTSAAPYRMLRGRMAHLSSASGTSLAEHLRSLADAVEAVERDECVKDEHITEGVSHVVVEWEGGDGLWTSTLVIE